MDINYFRKCKNVQRLSQYYTHRPYNLLEHQYMTAVLFKHFASKEDVAYGMAEFDAIMKHDVLEVESTDLSFEVKHLNDITREAWETIEDEVLKNNPQLERYSDMKELLTPLQHKLFKACDVLDLWIFCKEEQQLGNQTLNTVIMNCENLIRGKFKSIDKYMGDFKNGGQ